jgi:DNA-binding transcriptional regulator LsrR (DeoR family)
MDPIKEPISSVFDLSSASVQRMITLAQQQGYVTHHKLNRALPPRKFTSEQKERVIARLSGMGISIIRKESEEMIDLAVQRVIEGRTPLLMTPRKKPARA